MAGSDFDSAMTAAVYLGGRGAVPSMTLRTSQVLIIPPIQVSTLWAVILRATAINYQRAPDHSVDPSLVATGQHFAGTVMMI